MVGALFDRDRDVIQLHLGGGTPNFLRPRELGELMDSLVSHFHLSASPARDYSIELDPRTVEPGDVYLYAAFGFNRASLGVQDFDPAVQQAVNRIQSVEQTLRVIESCRAERFRSVNVDLIYGLPKQTAQGFGRTLDIVTDVRPDRLAIYGYAHMPQLFKGQRQIETADLPSAEAKLDLLRLAIDKLTAAGYVYIGMDHFALPEDELAKAHAAGTLHRNFMGYTTHESCDLVGLGMSAISHISDSFSQNARDVATWERALDEGRLPLWRGLRLNTDDVIRADVIQDLMCQGQVHLTEIERRHDIDFRAYFAAEIARLQPLIADDLVRMEADRIAVTSRGRLLVRIIAMCFDHYLNRAQTPDTKPAYSRVV